MKRKSWILVGIAAVVIAVMLHSSTSAPVGQSSAVIVYPVFCSDWVKALPTTIDFSNCKKPEALPREVYKADVTAQQVTESSPDTSLVYTLQGCDIVSIENWSCMSGGSMAGARGRFGGKLIAYGLSAVTFVTKSQWSSVKSSASTTK